MNDQLWTVISTIAATLGVLVAIVVPLIAWRSKVSRAKSAPNRDGVRQLDALFFEAAYNADVLAKGGEIDESLHVEKFKDASFKMHQIATVLIENNDPSSSIGKAVTEFYEAFRVKKTCRCAKPV